MGSEQSQQSTPGTRPASHASTPGAQRRSGSIHQPHPAPRPFTTGSRFQRGNTIAVSGQAHDQDSSTSTSGPQSPLIFRTDSRPVSPPMSVCSDSDLPYISYTDKPIGDSPKLRNKNLVGAQRNVRNSMYETSRKPAVVPKRPVPAHNIVVVRAAVPKDIGTDRDPDIQRIQAIPQFLPVMRASVSLPANRDPEVLERLQPAHLHNICNRMQTHLNLCASRVSVEQNLLNTRIKEVDVEASRVLALMTEKQKIYATYADHFSKVRQISQQLTRCNAILNQNIESLETLNNMLDVDQRLEPFVWTTTSAS